MAGSKKKIGAGLSAVSLVFALSGCVDNEGVVDQEGTIVPTTGVATPTEEPDSFEVNDVEQLETDETGGEIVEDPGMKVSYKWQGTQYAPNGGTVVTIEVTNHSESIMPMDALGDPELSYDNGKTATRKTGEDTGLEHDGLDLPLGKGASTNARYVYDVDPSNLWEAEFSIGNVTFKGNLNN